MESKHYALALSRISGVGSITYKKLVLNVGSAEGVFRAGDKVLSEIKGVKKNIVGAVSSFSDWDSIEEEVRKSEEVGAKIVSIEDSDYPERLKEIYDAPPVLYVRGELEYKDRFAVAVVGSRHPSTYGTISTESIAMGLSQRGITVVSGMARGIDSLAHKGALKGGGRTIAVLGSGVDVIYPPENKRLYNDIIGQGAVVSEFAIGTPPEASNFPRRNRIISGLVLGVVIVEASESSGALITANLALEQNREVFAVPGSITSMRSRGTHRLIREGAKLVENSDDIIEELKYIFGEGDLLKPSTFKEHQNIYKDLSGEEKEVLECISREPIHVDIIIEESGFASEKVLGILLELELKGLVRQIPGKSFVLGSL